MTRSISMPIKPTWQFLYSHATSCPSLDVADCCLDPTQHNKGFLALQGHSRRLMLAEACYAVCAGSQTLSRMCGVYTTWSLVTRWASLLGGRASMKCTGWAPLFALSAPIPAVPKQYIPCSQVMNHRCFVRTPPASTPPPPHPPHTQTLPPAEFAAISHYRACGNHSICVTRICTSPEPNRYCVTMSHQIVQQYAQHR